MTDAIQNPRVYPWLMTVWIICAACLGLGIATIWTAAVNVLLCRYFFVQMRWKNLSRGIGAPGFMTWWMGVAVLLLELSQRCSPTLQTLALFTLQIDFALIMLSSGIYKFTAGYPQNHGMELGLANPEWGYHWTFYRKLSPGHWLFRFLNQSGWLLQLLAALFMLWEPTRFLGGLIILLSFAFIATQIRLGLLCEIVMLGAVLFFTQDTPGDKWIAHLVPAWAASADSEPALPGLIQSSLGFGLAAYLILLPLAHLGLFYNFYGRKSLPRQLQRILEAYTNFFGIIIWRVFSSDLVNFFILIHREAKGDEAKRTLLTRYGWQGASRYRHVGEMIALTSVFTTLKYYPANSVLFKERLLRYARTIECPPDALLIFEYVSIRKTKKTFEFVATAEFRVDPSAGTIAERVLDSTVSVRAAHSESPIHEGVRPGSYVPLKA